jgi:hypothetical protein
LDDPNIDVDSVLSVVSEDGETLITPLDEASRQMLRDRLFSAGELLRLNQLAPDRTVIDWQNAVQADLFGDPQQ